MEVSAEVMQDIEERFLSKKMVQNRKVLVELKSMEEIMSQYPTYFDEYGNLHVNQAYNWPGANAALTPSDFKRLGRKIELNHRHSYPKWAIRHEWDDMFYPNMVLRHIASGKMSAEEMIALAKIAVLVPETEETA